MAFDVLAFAPPPAHAATVATFTVPIPTLAPRARCVGFTVRRPRVRTARAQRTHVQSLVTLLENLATVPTPSGTISAWFTAYVERVHRALETVTDAADGIGIAVAAPTGDGRTAVVLATTGPTLALLIHTRPRGEPAVVTIAHASPASAHLQFRHAIEGTLGGRDAIVLAPAALPECIPKPLLTHALTNLDRERGRTYLQHAIWTTGAPIGAIAIVGDAPRAPGPQSSMAAFLATATSTEHLLTPSLRPLLSAWWAHVRTTGALMHRSVRARGAERSAPRLTAAVAAVRLAFRTVGLLLRGAVTVLADGIRITVRALRPHGRTAARAQRDRAHGMTIPPTVRMRTVAALARLGGRLRDSVRALAARYDQLPRTSRNLSLLAAVAAFLFLSSTVILWRQRGVDARTSAFQATVTEVNTLRSVAEAKLLFGDLRAARDALHRASELLDALPRSTKPRRAQIAFLEREIAATLDRARLLTRVPEPLAVLRPDPASTGRRVRDVTVVGDQLIAVTADAAELLRIAPRTGATTTRALTVPAPLRDPWILALDDRSVLLMDADLRAAVVDIRTLAAHAAQVTAPPSGIRSAAVLRGRLYLLAVDGTVTRHERIASGFAKGARVPALPNAPTPDLLRDIDPPIADAAHVAVTRSGDHTYLGDPAEGRIVAVARDGALIGQVQSDPIRGFRRMLLDPAESAIYVLHRDGTISVLVPPKDER